MWLLAPPSLSISTLILHGVCCVFLCHPRLHTDGWCARLWISLSHISHVCRLCSTWLQSNHAGERRWLERGNFLMQRQQEFIGLKKTGWKRKAKGTVHRRHHKQQLGLFKKGGAKQSWLWRIKWRITSGTVKTCCFNAVNVPWRHPNHPQALFFAFQADQTWFTSSQRQLDRNSLHVDKGSQTIWEQAVCQQTRFVPCHLQVIDTFGSSIFEGLHHASCELFRLILYNNTTIYWANQQIQVWTEKPGREWLKTLFSE